MELVYSQSMLGCTILLELYLLIDSIHGIVPFVLTVPGNSWRACH